MLSCRNTDTSYKSITDVTLVKHNVWRDISVTRLLGNRPLREDISMFRTIWLGTFLRVGPSFDSVSHRRSSVSLSKRSSCDSLNVFTILVYPCRHVIGSHVSPVLSYPLQRTLYRVVFTLSSSTYLWKSSPIPTICSGIHYIDPSFYCANTFQTTSKYDVVVQSRQGNSSKHTWS